MNECLQCGDSWPRERMLSLNFATPENERPDKPELVCLRCALVAMIGGPSELSDEEKQKLRVK